MNAPLMPEGGGPGVSNDWCIIMSRQDKLNEGQVLLNDLNNYRPLDKPMVGTTTKKAQQLIKTLLSEGHIDKTTAKWLSLTPDSP